MKHDLLYDNKWIQLRETDNYVYSHESRCNGKIIAVLPFIPKPFKYLARYEGTPCQANGVIKFCAITGGVEHDDPIATTLLELKEEAGVVATADELIDLGTVYPSKSQDTVIYLYGIDITGKTWTTTPTGDGSEHERTAYCELSSDQLSLINGQDPLNIVMFSRLIALDYI